MIYLILAVLSSASIAILLRIGENHLTDKMTMFLGNYFVCTVMSAVYMGSAGLPAHFSGMPFTLILGVLSGILYLGSFLLFQYNIHRNGLVLPAVFMRLGVLVPVLMAILLFREVPGIPQLLGFTLAIVAILLINWERPGSGVGLGGQIWLLILLLASGFTDSMANIYDKMGAPELKDIYLLVTFGVAGLICLGILLKKHNRVTLQDLLIGVSVGIPNYYSARFLLLALNKIPAIITYPVYNVSTIITISLVGMFFFHERLNRLKWIGFGMILIALFLLNP